MPCPLTWKPSEIRGGFAGRTATARVRRDQQTNGAQQPPVTQLVVSDDELARAAVAVLVANQLDGITRPSPQLYPHQWSWDAAFIAMGYSHHDQQRAQLELRSLFAGQWGNGLLPHIVFSNAGGRYFPGPDYWQVERSQHAPTGTRTSGIVQPPVHATAALRVYRNATDRADATAFLEELLPKLVAWHDYLHRERTRDVGGLVEIWHPWESGMDNSPLWDEALRRITLALDEVPIYQRMDVEFNDASQRPSDAEYDRYAYLVQLFRSQDYDPGRIRSITPFAVQPVLYDAILVQADRDLAEIARLLGADPDPYEARADTTSRALNSLWDPEYAERARSMIDQLLATRVPVGQHGGAVPSLSPDDPDFEPSRYWRGPVWPVVHWLLSLGLSRYGHELEARQLGHTLIDLVRQGDFWEHYHPMTGRGQGGEQFAWTAAIVLDILGEGHIESTTAHTKEGPDGSNPTGR